AVIGGWLLIAVVTWPGTAHRDDPRPPLPEPAAPALASPLTVGPITFFSAACAPCHGDGGELFAERFWTDLDDAALRRTTAAMVRDQAQTSLPDADLAALTGYLRSLVRGTPFLAWTAAEGGVLRGEVTP